VSKEIAKFLNNFTLLRLKFDRFFIEVFVCLDISVIDPLIPSPVNMLITVTSIILIFYCCLYYNLLVSILKEFRYCACFVPLFLFRLFRSLLAGLSSLSQFFRLAFFISKIQAGLKHS
jgi:hypothetical protein